MKKKLEAELISIAHRVLKLKNRSETVQLQEEAKKLYEQLTILRFYEENIDVVEKEIAATDFEEKLAAFTSNEKPLAETTAVEISLEEKEETIEEVQEVISEEMHSEEEIVAQEEALEANEPHLEEEVVEETQEEIVSIEETVEEIQEEVVAEEIPAKETAQPQQISFEDVFGADFKEPEFVKVEDVPIEVEQAAELSFEAVEETEEAEEAEEPVFETKTVVEEVMIERTETIQATKTTTFQEEPKSMSLNDRLNKGINIGLNDRIAFEKRLFGGSPDDFNRVLSQLNTFDTFEEAKGFIEDFVKPDYDNWNGKEEYEARFLEIVEKKFN